MFNIREGKTALIPLIGVGVLYAYILKGINNFLGCRNIIGKWLLGIL